MSLFKKILGIPEKAKEPQKPVAPLPVDDVDVRRRAMVDRAIRTSGAGILTPPATTRKRNLGVE